MEPLAQQTLALYKQGPRRITTVHNRLTLDPMPWVTFMNRLLR